MEKIRYFLTKPFCFFSLDVFKKTIIHVFGRSVANSRAKRRFSISQQLSVESHLIWTRRDPVWDLNRTWPGLDLTWPRPGLKLNWSYLTLRLTSLRSMGPPKIFSVWMFLHSSPPPSVSLSGNETLRTAYMNPLESAFELSILTIWTHLLHTFEPLEPDPSTIVPPLNPPGASSWTLCTLWTRYIHRCASFEPTRSIFLNPLRPSNLRIH